MKLGIDAREIQNGVYTGIGRPLYNFIKYFSKQNNDDTCVLFSERELPFNFGAKVKNIVIKKCPVFFWDQYKLPQAIKKEEIDLFYSPYYKIPLAAPCKVISAILDLMYIFFKEYRKKLGTLGILYYKTFGKKFAESSYKILTCSEHSKKDIIKFYGIEAEKIKVIPLSLSDIYKPEDDAEKIKAVKEKFNIKSRYLLYMGNFKPHKNVKNIILAFNKISERFNDLNLVLAGPKNNEFSQLKNLVEGLRLTDKVIFTGKVTEEDCPNVLYSQAEAFIFPSFYEGFGLPPLEAMACKTAVIASKTTSIPEVVKDAGILVDPIKVEKIAEAITEILTNTAIKNSLIEKGMKYAQEYKDAEISKQLYEFLKI